MTKTSEKPDAKIFQVVLTDRRGRESVGTLSTSYAGAYGFATYWNSHHIDDPKREVASIRAAEVPAVLRKPLPKSASVRIKLDRENLKGIAFEERMFAKYRTKERFEVLKRRCRGQV